MMADPIFVFGPAGRYFYKAKTIVSSGLPTSIQSVIDLGLAQDVHCVAFGPTPESYYFNYTDTRTSVPTKILGDALPERLLSILKAIPNQEAPNIKITLGPSNSFVIWNTVNPLLLWEGVPFALATSLKEWYKNFEWTAGPPCFVALGVEDAYFAVCEGHSASYYLPEKFSILKDTWMALWRDIGDFSARNILYMSISPCLKDRFVIIERTCRGADIGRVYISVSQGVRKINQLLWEFDQDQVCILDNLPGEGYPGQWCPVKRYYKKREPNELTLRESDIIEVLKKCSKIWWFGRNPRGQTGYFPARNIIPPREEETAPVITYSQWAMDVKRVMEQGSIKKFPAFPSHIRTCGQHVCYEDVQDHEGIRACRHDVEAFLKTSRSYGYFWLKTQRLRWHPDQFGKRCDPEFRDSLRRKAEQLFVIFGLLMDEQGTREYHGESE